MPSLRLEALLPSYRACRFNAIVIGCHSPPVVFTPRSPCRAVTMLCLALLASGCANTPSPSEIAQAEGAAATLESTADSACPNEALRIHEAAAQLRELIRTWDFGSAALEMTALTALTNACKTEKENCGTGPARIGMTVAEAIHTSWCFPDKVNRTETAGHVEEQ
jgi:hypothetical protein